MKRECDSDFAGAGTKPGWSTLTVLVFGTVAYDDVETPSGTRTSQLGGSAAYFAVAASYFTDVAILSVVGEDFQQSDLDLLRDHGIDTSGIETADGETFHWSGRYMDDLNVAETVETHLNVLVGYQPTVQSQHRIPDQLFLANGDPSLQRFTLDSLSERPRVVAGDTMNHWITENRDELVDTISRLDVAIINETEALMLSGEAGIARAATAILDIGCQYVVIKRGEYGAAMFGRDTLFATPAFPLANVVDPTGAGDSFAGGFVGYLATVDDINDGTLRNAVMAGSTMASMTVQDFGLGSLANLDRDILRKRFADFAELTSYPAQHDPLLEIANGI